MEKWPFEVRKKKKPLCPHDFAISYQYRVQLKYELNTDLVIWAFVK
jgi:hypothetical protein